MKPDEKIKLYEIIKDDVNGKYNFQLSDLDILKISENITVLLKTTTDEKYILRVNRPNYHTFEELTDEITWMDAIEKETDITIPSVVANIFGNKISEFSTSNSYGKYYSIFSFINGSVLNNLSSAELLNRMKDVGLLAAKLHKQVKNNPYLNHLNRFTWNYDDLIGDTARWGDWKQNKLLNDSQKNTLTNALDKISHSLQLYGKNPTNYGLIHSDFHLSNIMCNNNSLSIIDFDDCGYGWFLYECGCSLLQYNNNIEELANAWLTGYCEIINLNSKDTDMIWAFIIIRRIARIGWMHTHASSDTAKNIDDFYNYIETTTNLCTKYLDNKLCDFSYFNKMH